MRCLVRIQQSMARVMRWSVRIQPSMARVMRCLVQIQQTMACVMRWSVLYGQVWHVFRVDWYAAAVLAYTMR